MWFIDGMTSGRANPPANSAGAYTTCHVEQSKRVTV